MSKPRSQTIRIFLPSGNPRGIRKVERSSNSNIRLFDIPRSELGVFCQMSEAADMGIYFLLGSNQLYIGQTSDLGARLKTHDKAKPFWQRAFVVVLNNDFRTLDHLYYLEKTAIEQAKAAKRFALENGTDGNKHRHLHDSIRSDCENIFDEIETLLAVLNQEFFTAEETMPSESLAAEKETNSPDILQFEAETETKIVENLQHIQEEIFYCKSSGADASGYLHEDGKQFVVRAGSLILRRYADYAPSAMKQVRQQWLSDGSLSPVGEAHYRLNRDCVCSSVSYAAVFVIGRNTNGWKKWKNAENQTIDKCYHRTTQNKQSEF